MVKDKGFRKINELVTALAEAERALRDSTLGLEGLATACDNARELYERLVVLRHKAREAALLSGGGASAPAVAASERPAVAEPAPPSIRLDTRPPEAIPGQTSLIDAIEEAATIPTPKRKPADGAAQRTQASDLAKAISLDRKFWFVAELFNGDRTAYDKAIEHLNAAKDLAAANSFVEKEVEAKLKKPADPEALAAFKELLERHFTP